MRLLNFRRIPVLDRWLIEQLFPPLLFSIGIFAIINISLGELIYLTRMIVDAGLLPNNAFMTLLYKIPSYLVISFPMATLLASLFTFSTLSSKSEIKALFSLGIPLRRIIVSSILIGILMTGLTYCFNELIVPYTNKQSQASFMEGLGRGRDINYREHVLYSDYVSTNKLNYLFYANRYSDNIMYDVTVLEHIDDFNKILIKADDARWNELEKYWSFSNASITSLNKGEKLSTITSKNYIYPLNSGPMAIANIPKDSNNINFNSLVSAIQLYEGSGNLQDAQKLRVRLQQKISLPITCIIFSLIGASLGSRNNINSSQSFSFGLTILLIFIYYLFSFIFSSLGVSGSLSPFFAAWSPTFISFICIELYLRKASIY